jgi:integrase
MAASNLTLWKKANAPKTEKRYTEAALEFLRWCDENFESPVTYEELDDTFAEYVEFAYETGVSLSRAEYALHGLCNVIPRAKPFMMLSRQQLRGWRKSTVKNPHPPLTWGLACAIATRLALTGHIRYAVGLLLSFDCFLRVGELVALRREDIAIPGEARVDDGYDKLGVRLRQTKTGPNKFVSVHFESVASLLRDVVLDTKKGGRLFPFSASSFRYHMKKACRELGLSDRYVPHSLRHGGATYWFTVLGKPINDVMTRGRWAVVKSAEHYIQSGAAIMLSVDVPLRVAQLGKRAATNLLLYIHRAQAICEASLRKRLMR